MYVKKNTQNYEFFESFEYTNVDLKKRKIGICKLTLSSILVYFQKLTIVRNKCAWSLRLTVSINLKRGNLFEVVLTKI